MNLAPHQQQRKGAEVRKSFTEVSSQRGFRFVNWFWLLSNAFGRSGCGVVILLLLSLSVEGAQSPRGREAFPKLGQKATTTTLTLPGGLTLTLTNATTHSYVSQPVTVLPPPSPTNVVIQSISKLGAAQFVVRWAGGPDGATFQLQSKTNVLQSAWSNIGAPTANFAATNVISGKFAMFRVAATSAPPISGWARHIGSSGDDRPTGLAVRPDGSIIVSGYFGGSGDVAGSPISSVGTLDMYVANLSSNGAPVWVQQYRAAPGSFLLPIACGVDANNNTVVAGHFNGTVNLGFGNLVSAGGFDLFVASYSAIGSPRWARRFGGGSDEFVTSVAVAAGGDCVVSGTFSGTANFGGTNVIAKFGGTDSFLAKYDILGNHSWSCNFPNISSDRIERVAFDGSGNVILLGTTDAFINFGGADISAPAQSGSTFLVKLAGTSAHVWSRAVASSAPPKGLALDSANNIYIAGIYGGTIGFGGPVLTNAGSTDMYIAKFAPADGAHVWSKGYGGTGPDTPATIAVGNNVAVAGNFYFGTRLGGAPLVSAGEDDAFSAVYSATTGAHVASRAMGGPQTDGSTAVAWSGTNVIQAGVFRESATINGQPLTALGVFDGFLTKFAP